MAYLKKQGFLFYSASELMTYFCANGRFPPRGLAITFDDGWKDNYDNAFPILRRFGIKATVSLIPSCIGEVSTKAMSKGESGRAHLSRAEIIEMSKYGIEFGSHSLNHKLLHQIPLSEVREEVEESKRQIEALVQKPCTLFVYPAGFFTKDVQHIVKTAGYMVAFTTVYGPSDASDLYALNRIEILRRDRLFLRFARKVKPLS
jgi:peptidoglycan/xylan/chitin deacetylase (PgdA/CDA1 family)